MASRTPIPTSRSTRQAALAAAAALILALAAAGCRDRGEPAPPPASQPAATQSAVPKLPEEIAKPLDESAPTGMELLVRNPARPRNSQEDYQQDEKCPVGKLVGAVRFAGPLLRREQLPPVRKLDTPEALGVVDPKPGEVDYFLNTRLTELRYLHHDFVQPIEAVIMLRGIRTGRRAMLSRPTFLVREGMFRPHIQFAPPHERVMFGTYDSYPTDVRIKGLGGGELLAEVLVSAYDRSQIRDLGGGGVELKAPQMAQSPVIHDPGGYRFECPRHPWKSGYVFVVDNPYALVCNGDFTIGDVPVGQWRLDVWHARFKPVKTTLQVEIKEDATTEVAVEFEPPEYIRSK
jgi:hypothetical protein